MILLSVAQPVSNFNLSIQEISNAKMIRIIADYADEADYADPIFLRKKKSDQRDQ